MEDEFRKKVNPGSTVRDKLLLDKVKSLVEGLKNRHASVRERSAQREKMKLLFILLSSLGGIYPGDHPYIH